MPETIKIKVEPKKDSSGQSILNQYDITFDASGLSLTHRSEAALAIKSYIEGQLQLPDLFQKININPAAFDFQKYSFSMELKPDVAKLKTEEDKQTEIKKVLAVAMQPTARLIMTDLDLVVFDWGLPAFSSSSLSSPPAVSLSFVPQSQGPKRNTRNDLSSLTWFKLKNDSDNQRFLLIKEGNLDGGSSASDLFKGDNDYANLKTFLHDTAIKDVYTKQTIGEAIDELPVLKDGDKLVSIKDKDDTANIPAYAVVRSCQAATPTSQASINSQLVLAEPINELKKMLLVIHAQLSRDVELAGGIKNLRPTPTLTITITQPKMTDYELAYIKYCALCGFACRAKDTNTDLLASAEYMTNTPIQDLKLTSDPELQAIAGKIGQWQRERERENLPPLQAQPLPAPTQPSSQQALQGQLNEQEEAIKRMQDELTALKAKAAPEPSGINTQHEREQKNLKDIIEAQQNEIKKLKDELKQPAQPVQPPQEAPGTAENKGGEEKFEVVHEEESPAAQQEDASNSTSSTGSPPLVPTFKGPPKGPPKVPAFQAPPVVPPPLPTSGPPAQLQASVSKSSPPIPPPSLQTASTAAASETPAAPSSSSASDKSKGAGEHEEYPDQDEDPFVVEGETDKNDEEFNDEKFEVVEEDNDGSSENEAKGGEEEAKPEDEAKPEEEENGELDYRYEVIDNSAENEASTSRSGSPTPSDTSETPDILMRGADEKASLAGDPFVPKQPTEETEESFQQEFDALAAMKLNEKNEQAEGVDEEATEEDQQEEDQQKESFQIQSTSSSLMSASEQQDDDKEETVSGLFDDQEESSKKVSPVQSGGLTPTETSALSAREVTSPPMNVPVDPNGAVEVSMVEVSMNEPLVKGIGITEPAESSSSDLEDVPLDSSRVTDNTPAQVLDNLVAERQQAISNYAAILELTRTKLMNKAIRSEDAASILSSARGRFDELEKRLNSLNLNNDAALIGRRNIMQEEMKTIKTSSENGATALLNAPAEPEKKKGFFGRFFSNKRGEGIQSSPVAPIVQKEKENKQEASEAPKQQSMSPNNKGGGGPK